jgi:DNA-binding NarL/FixJ family response regulator
MSKPIRVLIADDNARSRSGLRALLDTVRLKPSVALGRGGRNESWPEVEVVGEAANGREAVRQITECRPDVVLMDVRMPVMDGLDATRLIKSKWPGARIVVLTLYAAYRAEALAAGADAFLVKGCPNEELFAAILNSEELQSNPRC